MFSSQQDIQWMQYAIQLACKAEESGEVPVGAVLVVDNEVIGEGWNLSIIMILVRMRKLWRSVRRVKIGNYRLLGATLYVTLEPCVMCAGAMVHSRISRLVYGACDLKTGAAGSVFDVLSDPVITLKVQVSGGVG